MKRRVVVTGLGAVTPIGNTVEEFWNGIKEGKGIFTWEDGRIFKGPFTKGKPNGKGILIINDIELEVEFNKGKILGNVKEMIAQQRKKNI